MSKKPIRFFNDREVRAVWDNENGCRWFAATDVVRAINDEPDYTKAGNSVKKDSKRLYTLRIGIQFNYFEHLLS